MRKELSVNSKLKAMVARNKPAVRWNEADATSECRALIQKGYSLTTIVPHNIPNFPNAGKVPGVFGRGKWYVPKGWQAAALTDGVDQLLHWVHHSADVPNFGIVFGFNSPQGFLIGIDIDCLAPNLKAKLAKLFGVAFRVRHGRKDREGLIMVQLKADGLSGLPEVFVNGGDKIQILKSGKQAVAAGIHPSGVAYRWCNALGEDDDVPALSDLPAISFDELNALLLQHGFKASKSSEAKAVKVDSVEARRLLSLYDRGELPDADKTIDNYGREWFDREIGAIEQKHEGVEAAARLDSLF